MSALKQTVLRALYNDHGSFLINTMSSNDSYWVEVKFKAKIRFDYKRVKIFQSKKTTTYFLNSSIGKT